MYERTKRKHVSEESQRLLLLNYYLLLDEAFVTLATNDVYCRGALVLAESLKKQGTTRKLVVMIAPHVSEVAR